MRHLRSLLLKLRAVFFRSRVEREMEAEFAAHLDDETQDLIRSGIDPAEARRRAAAALRPIELIRDDCRDSRGVAPWERLAQDAAFGLRLLVRNRVFSFTALATLALAIGATTAVYALVDRILLRPLPYAAPERLFYANDVLTRGHFDAMRSHSKLADYAADLGVSAFNFRAPDRTERVTGAQVSANFFRVLGVSPLLGRDLPEGADKPGAPRIAILSHAFWTDRFSAAPGVIGRQLILDDAPYEIVAVMPADFQFPSPQAAFWIPMRLDPRNAGEYWGINVCFTIARLHAGVSPTAAIAELRAWTPRVHAMFPWPMPDSWGADATLEPLRSRVVAGIRVRSMLMMAAVALLLLIALVNVANLMAAQTAARRAEFALRVSLGATTARLARQLITEALLLASLGGALGVLLAIGLLDLLERWLPADTPRIAEASIDPRVLAFAAAISLAGGLFFGLLPALGVRPRASLAPATPRTGAALVACETAFLTVLLVAAGLVSHSFWQMLHAPLGNAADSVVTAELSPNRDVAASLPKTLALYAAVREKLTAYPGVRNVAAMSQLPLAPTIAALTFAIEDHPRPPQAPQFVLWTTAVTPEHLDTLGIRLLSGRAFTPADRANSAHVVLVSRAMALKFWPSGNPVGRRIRPVWEDDWRTIVGVVDDVKAFSLSGPPSWVDGEIYIPFAQATAPPRHLALVARLGNDPAAFERALPAIVHDLCSTCAVSKIAAMDRVVSDAVAAPRTLAVLIGSFAVIALLLAAAGIYGVVMHGVIRRTREIGVRLALGATPGGVRWLIVAATLRQVAAGAAIGLAASWALARFTDSLLYGITRHDALSFALPPLLLLAFALLAALTPMIRASRIDPAAALRVG